MLRSEVDAENLSYGGLQEAFAHPETSVVLFGKAGSYPGRRMGVVLSTADNTDAAHLAAREAGMQITIESDDAGAGLAAGADDAASADGAQSADGAENADGTKGADSVENAESTEGADGAESADTSGNTVADGADASNTNSPARDEQAQQRGNDHPADDADGADADGTSESRA